MADLSLTCPTPAVEAGVSSINVTATGAVTITGAGESFVTTVGQTITVSGTEHVTIGTPNEPDIDSINTVTGTMTLAGTGGITIVDDTVDSDTPVLTVSGFRTEFVNASGALSAEIDADIATHAAIVDAHHIRYTQDENDAIVAGSNITVVSGSNIITISSTAAGGGGGDTAIAGADGITVISGVPTEGEVTVSGFRTEFVSASGALQADIDSIDSSVTLQDAYDNADGTIVLSSANKPVVVATGTVGVDTLSLSISGNLVSSLIDDFISGPEKGLLTQVIDNFVVFTCDTIQILHLEGEGASSLSNSKSLTSSSSSEIHAVTSPGTKFYRRDWFRFEVITCGNLNNYSPSGPTSLSSSKHQSSVM